MTTHAQQHWAIVGGGMLGMTLALRLLERGQRVTILEAAPELGGLASPWELGGVTWDRHYHVTLLSDSYLRNVLAEIGLENELVWKQTKTGFFTDGRLHSMSSSIEFLRFPPLSLIEKLRLGGTIAMASRMKNWRELEKIPVGDWLRKWSGRGVFEKVWEPLLLAKLGEAYKRTSAAFIWAYINRMYKARRSGLKREMFGYVRGGYARVLGRFANVLQEKGAHIQCNAAVAQAEATDDSRVAIQLRDGERREFDNVVFTTPSNIVADSCPEMAPQQRERHEAVEYLGIVCASMLLRRPISPYYVTNITDRDAPVTGVIEMTNIVDPSEVGGHHLVYLPKYVMSDDHLFNESDESIRERWIAALEQMYPTFSRDDVRAFRISRVRRVMALPTLEYSARLPGIVTGVPGVFAVNSAQIVEGTLNVDETIRIAEEAIDGLLAAAGDQSAKPAANQADIVAFDDRPKHDEESLTAVRSTT